MTKVTFSFTRLGFEVFSATLTTPGRRRDSMIQQLGGMAHHPEAACQHGPVKPTLSAMSQMTHQPLALAARFDDPYQFSKTFKRIYGVSPEKFAKLASRRP